MTLLLGLALVWALLSRWQWKHEASTRYVLVERQPEPDLFELERERAGL